ncbi:MAG: VOC family protein [Candidatus Nitrosopolaris sp.]
MKKAEVQNITHHLWFDKKAEASIFKNSKIVDTPHYEELAVGASGRLKGTVMTVTFEVEGQRFTALTRVPLSVIKFSPAISFFVNCETQEEVNDLWEKEIAPNNRNPILFND